MKPFAMEREHNHFPNSTGSSHDAYASGHDRNESPWTNSDRWQEIRFCDFKELHNSKAW